MAVSEWICDEALDTLANPAERLASWQFHQPINTVTCITKCPTVPNPRNTNIRRASDRMETNDCKCVYRQLQEQEQQTTFRAYAKLIAYEP